MSGCSGTRSRGRTASIIVGVDEAGRGSIVGEMFVAAFGAPKGFEEKLLELGVRDSKELTPHTRAALYRQLVRLGRIGVAAVPPKSIDSGNLNRLTEKAILRAVDAIARQVGGYASISSVVVDRFGSPRLLPEALRRRGFRGILIVEERADKKYPYVAAASIVAKHLRDLRMKVLSSMYGVPGSGYPSDPRTMDWVRAVLRRGERPPIIRYSWSSLKEYGYGKKIGKARPLDEWLG